MTNEQLFGGTLRFIIVPIFLTFVGVGAFGLYRFWKQELVAKELYTWEAVPAMDYTISGGHSTSDLSITFKYGYAGQVYEQQGFSPFSGLNEEFKEDKELAAWVLSRGGLLTVYVNPDQPTQATIFRGWPQGKRLEDLMVGGIMLTLGLVVLYFTLRPTPSVEELF